jgi:hypothetical protein
MRKLYRHTARGNFVTLGFTSSTGLDDQDSHPPIRCLPFLFEGGVVTDGQVDLDRARRELERKLPHLPHDLICLDLESEPLFAGRTSWSADRNEWQRFIETVLPILEALRSVDDTVKWSLFGCCPSLVVRHVNAYQANRTAKCLAHKDDPQESRYKEWLNAVELMRFQAEHLAPHLDWYCPSLYPDYWHSKYAQNKGRGWYFWDDHSQNPDDVMASFAAQASEWDVMRDVTNMGLSVARHILPNKPLIPILGAQWFQAPLEGYHHPQWEFVDHDWIRNSLHQVRTLADSVAIWAQPNKANLTSAEYYDGPLWRFVRRWAAQQAGE